MATIANRTDLFKAQEELLSAAAEGAPVAELAQAAETYQAAYLADRQCNDYFHTVQEAPDRIGVYCNGGMELRWATLELVPFFFDEEGRDRYQWIVRRFDWFDPSPHRDPSFKQAVTPNELRELLTIIDKLEADLGGGS